ncbi:FadR family transcriptional regulator [Rhodobacteraceae bacterium R_SAG2]|nr:FadR family transcriptional regulator [Rhodobacteraceae bacterium R_SAG2]
MRAASMFTRVTPILRSQMVAEQIASKIRAARMQIGDKLLTEREMAKSMDVSRNTLRDAIAMLQMAGVVEVRRSSGIFVASIPDEEEVHQWMKEAELGRFTDSQTAIDARIALEPGAAVLVANTATPEDWARFDGYLAKMQEAVDRGDVQSYRKCDNDLHKALAVATGNDLLISILLPVIETARQPLWAAIKNNIYRADVLQNSLTEHRQIIEAMRSGDELLILQAFRNHLKNSESRLRIDSDV